MNYTIGSDMHIYTADGRKLPRTEVAFVIDQVNASLSRPVSLYMMANITFQNTLKVGIADNVQKRKYENERDFGGRLEVLDVTVAMDRQAAGEIERSIHRFLTALGRGPIYKQEYFKLVKHDVWLLRNVLNEMPIKAAAYIFDLLRTDYVPMLQDYHAAPAFVTEEIRLHFGNSVAYHAGHEVKCMIPKAEAA